MKAVLVLALLAVACAPAALAIVAQSDLLGRWHGRCLQYAAVNTTTNEAYCTSYHGAPVTYDYHVEYTLVNGVVNVNYNTSDPVYPTPAGQSFPSSSDSGVLSSITKYLAKSCLSVQFQNSGNASYVVTVTTISATNKTYTEEGVYFIPADTASNECLYKAAGKLYCEARYRYNYMCTATLY